MRRKKVKKSGGHFILWIATESTSPLCVAAPWAVDPGGHEKIYWVSHAAQTSKQYLSLSASSYLDFTL